MRMDMLVEAAGWTGVVTLLGAYTLLSRGAVSQRSWPYHLMNLAGACLLAWNSAMVGHVPFLVFNAVWALVGAMGVVRAVRARSRAHPRPSPSSPPAKQGCSASNPPGSPVKRGRSPSSGVDG